MLRSRSVSLSLLALLLAGCGGSGGGGKSDSLDPTARVGPQLTIDWPARARGVSAPASANFAQVIAPGAGANGADATAVVARPEGAAASSKTYTLPIALQPGNRVLRIDFYPSSPSGFVTGSNAVLATITLNVKVLNDGALRTLEDKPLGSIAVESTVASVALNSGQTVEVGAKSDLALSVTNATGQSAAVPPGGVAYTIVSGADRLRLNADNSFTGLSAGTATVTATVAGKTSDPVTVTVLEAPVSSRVLLLKTTALVADPSRGRLWAALPPDEVNGNSVVSIDPAKGSRETTIPVGADPSVLAISEDGSLLYAGLRGAGVVRRVDLATNAAVGQFSLLPDPNFGGPSFATDLAVQPGNASVVAVIASSQSFGQPNGPVVYDGGVARPVRPTNFVSGKLLWASSQRIVLGNGFGNSGMQEYGVDAQGVALSRTVLNGASGAARFVLAGGRIYDVAGGVFDSTSLDKVGAFTLGSSSGASIYGPIVDTATRRAYFVELNGYSQGAMLRTLDIDTFAQVSVRRIDLPSNVGSPFSQAGTLVRAGTNGLALQLPDRIVFLDDVLGS